MPKIELKVVSPYTTKRIDVYLVQALEGKFSRPEIKACLDKGQFLLNGKSAKPRTLVKDGDLIRGEIALSEKISPLVGEDIPVKVIYEDDWLLVVDKPVGMVVHPGAGNKKGTLVHALLGRGGLLSKVGGETRPGIVHRLDKETSGILLVAKNDEAHRFLQEQFASRTLSKTYTALVRGKVEYEEGHVSAALDRHPKIRYKRAVSDSETAKLAETKYRVLKRFRYATLLEIRPLTGRTHQIRVHMAHLGYPVVGDVIYGTKKEGERLALHASKIEFAHPKDGKIMKFESPLPDDFKELIKRAEIENG